MSARNWSPPLAAVGLAAVLAVITGVLTVLAVVGITPASGIDGPGRLLLGVATVVLAALTCHGALARPRLAADHEGVTVRGLRSRHSWGWQSLRYQVRYTSRLGRRQATLELDGVDTGGVERLVVLGRVDLGTDPVDVEAALTALRHG